MPVDKEIIKFRAEQAELLKSKLDDATPELFIFRRNTDQEGEVIVSLVNTLFDYA